MIKDKPIICKRCGKATKNHSEVDAWPWIRYEGLEKQLEADLCFECGAKLLVWLRIKEDPK